jgi:putative holliday junction resolvase
MVDESMFMSSVRARIMGLDIGERRVGVAISDPLGWTAQGIEVIDRKAKATATAWIERLAQLIQTYQIAALVIGFPRNMDGTIGPRGQVCKQLAKELEASFSLPVYLWDERLSTVAVERTLLEADIRRSKRKQVIDKMSAVWILQGYLDAQRR